jgi:hypothetical protein
MGVQSIIDIHNDTSVQHFSLFWDEKFQRYFESNLSSGVNFMGAYGGQALFQHDITAGAKHYTEVGCIGVSLYTLTPPSIIRKYG